ncbi:cell division protein SepF [Candidatus Woesearchaeota archaeon]|nr:cell division protein SepF [Candidatus Woesearchaeota archaeon]
MVKAFIERMKKSLGVANEPDVDEVGDEYVELDVLGDTNDDGKKPKVIVRPFVINDFSDIKPVLDSMREGYTIGLINIKPLKNKDLVELKRAINKLKKTCDAIEGDIAGFGDDYLVIAPSFARIYRTKDTAQVKEE